MTTPIQTAFAALQATVTALSKVPLRRTTSDMAATNLIKSLVNETAALALVLTPPAPVVPLPESPDITQVPPATEIVDSNGLVWTLVASPTAGNQIAKGGVVDQITNNVTKLAYLNHTVWQEAYGLYWNWKNGAWQMAATHICIIYNCATKQLLRVVIPDTDAQITLPGGPCTAHSSECLVQMPMSQWLANPTIVAAQAAIPSGGIGRNFLTGIYNYARGGPQTPYSTHPSPGPTATGLTLGQRFDHEWTRDDGTGQGFSPGNPTYPQYLAVSINNQGASLDYGQVANGNFDPGFRATFNSAKSQGIPVYFFVLDKEFNISNNAWSNAGPTVYKAALDHVISIGKSIYGTGPGAPKYCWNLAQQIGQDLSAFIPSTVDIIGIDAYTNAFYHTLSSDIFGPTDGSVVGTLWWWTRIAQQQGKALSLPECGDGPGAATATPDAIYYNAIFDWAYNITLGTWAGAFTSNNVVDISFYESGTAADATAANANPMSNAQFDALVNRLRGKTYSGTYFQFLQTNGNDSFM